jgi:hypothetical protein
MREVSPTEAVSRFVTSERWVKGGIVKPQAFMPRDNALSVYRTRDVSERRVWRIGRRIASFSHGGILFGRAELSVRAIGDRQLGFKRGWLPSLHVDVVGWPDVGESAKSEQKLIAAKLAEQSAYVPDPDLTPTP